MIALLHIHLLKAGKVTLQKGSLRWLHAVRDLQHNTSMLFHAHLQANPRCSLATVGMPIAVGILQKLYEDMANPIPERHPNALCRQQRPHLAYYGVYPAKGKLPIPGEERTCPCTKPYSARTMAVAILSLRYHASVTFSARIG